MSAVTLSQLLSTQAGSYEFRLFSNNTYTRVTTSATVVIAPLDAQVVVNGAVSPDVVTVPAGSLVTVTIANGPGNPTDWVALAAVGSADATNVDWRYLNGTTVPPSSGLSVATVTFAVPVTPGTYEVRFFANNTYARIATSGHVIALAVSRAAGHQRDVAVDGGVRRRGRAADDPGVRGSRQSGRLGRARASRVGRDDVRRVAVPQWRADAAAVGASGATLAFIAPTTGGPLRVPLLREQHVRRAGHERGADGAAIPRRTSSSTASRRRRA